MKSEIRMIIAETLLGWAMSIAAKSKDGDTLVLMVKNYFEIILKHNE